jgi:hypothetical protein
MNKFYIKKVSIGCLMIFGFIYLHAQSGNRVFTGGEFTNLGTIDLAAPGGQSWSTDRLATPGYFSATMGAIYTGASDAANINGYVKKYGNEAFTFPVGTGLDLRTLAISAPGAYTDVYATAWILGDPSGNLDPTGPNGGPHNISSMTPPINAVSNIGQWDWQTGINLGATGNGAGLTVTASIPDMTTFAATSSLRLVGWNGSSWIDLSGAATASGNTENSSLTGTMVAGISAIGIGSIDFDLPLNLVSFTAQENGCNASLNWTTTNEQNTANFDVEQSDDGTTFHLAGIVAAKNNIRINNYSFIENQTSSVNYYRLKMIDRDGVFTYSPVEIVKTNCSVNNDLVSVYPNPVKSGYVYINFSTQVSGPGKLSLVNQTGQQEMIINVTINTGNNLQKLQLDQIPKGVYFIQLLSAINKPIFQPQKIIIE